MAYLSKEAFGMIAILFTVATTLPYLRRMMSGHIRPHIFTWFIWFATGCIAAAARSAAAAGPGAWVQWAGALSCLSVVLFSLVKGDHNITKTDVLALLSAFTAIPAWLVTHDPFYAVLIVSFIDCIGYYPTFRKAYAAPHHDAIFNYVNANIIQILALLSSANYSPTNVLYPTTMLVANSLIIAYVAWRRRCVPMAAYAPP